MDNKPFEKKKSLGQHFLTSDVVPNWMCDAADIAAGDTVVEIGPGTGILTKELLGRGATVIALEADQRALTVLEETFQEQVATGDLQLHHTDVRDFSLESLDLPTGSFKVVANIPYYLSGLLFRTFLSETVKPSTLVFLVQKEVAKRACSKNARGDKESLLSLAVQAFGEPSYIKDVSRGHFTPPPKVDSGIIAVRDISNEHFTALKQEHFFEVLHLGFGQKRKQLLGNLANIYQREALTDIFSTLEIPLAVRAEDLPLETWLSLSMHLQSTATNTSTQ